MAKKRDSTGQYTESVGLNEVLDIFQEVEGPPVITSADVAEATELSNNSARRKLQRLIDQGEVQKRKSAGRVLYYRTDYLDTKRSDSSEDLDKEFEWDDLGRYSTDVDDARSRSIRQYYMDTGPTTKHGKDALVDFFEIVRDRRKIKSRDLKSKLYPYYNDEYKNERSMWEALRRYSGDIPGVRSSGHAEWVFDEQAAKERLAKE